MKSHLVHTSQSCHIRIYAFSNRFWQACRKSMHPREVLHQVNHVTSLLANIAEARSKVRSFDMIVIATE